MGLLYYLYDMERTTYAFKKDQLHINFDLNKSKLNANLHKGRCVYAREVVGLLEVNRNGVRYDEATQTVYLDVWNDVQTGNPPSRAAEREYKAGVAGKGAVVIRKWSDYCFLISKKTGK